MITLMSTPMGLLNLSGQFQPVNRMIIRLHPSLSS